ncbi:MAG: DoxX family protein [Candidatus Eremiobacteraeota bacterium]|nr:DoxX family protein [Candidatus Eremiobacteraeota bacterium]
MRDVATAAARAVLGASIAAHGTQKLYGWFDGPGIEGATHFMGVLGFHPGERYARLSASTEIAAGVLIATGTLGPVGPALLASVMTTAAGSVHVQNGYFNEKKGFELNTMYALAALLLAANGFGRISVDHAIGLRKRSTPLLGTLGIIGGIAGGLFMLAQRRPQEPSSVSAPSNTTQTETGTIDSSYDKATMAE